MNAADEGTASQAVAGKLKTNEFRDHLDGHKLKEIFQLFFTQG